MKNSNYSISIKNISASIFSIFFLLVTYSANSAILLDADWEKLNATFNDYYLNISRNNYGSTIIDSSTSNEPVCSGTKSVKHLLTYGKGSVWSQLTLNMSPFTSFSIGKEHWFSFAVFLPLDYTPDTAEEVIWEMHGRADYDEGESSRNAPVAIRTLGTDWIISYHKDSKRITTKPIYEESASKNIGQFTTGKWTTFVINTLWDYNSNGFLKIWKDGLLVVDKKNGIGFNDAKGPFIKMGIYKSKWDASKSWSGPTDVTYRKLYIDDFKVGDAKATYQSMEPKCNAKPVLEVPQGLSFTVN